MDKVVRIDSVWYRTHTWVIILKKSEVFIHRVSFGDSKFISCECGKAKYKRVKGMKVGKVG